MNAVADYFITLYQKRYALQFYFFARANTAAAFQRAAFCFTVTEVSYLKFPAEQTQRNLYMIEIPAPASILPAWLTQP